MMTQKCGLLTGRNKTVIKARVKLKVHPRTGHEGSEGE
jgi:hypothetical protein